MTNQATETVLVLDQATRARIRALHDYRAAGWAPLGVDCHWWSQSAKGLVETIPLSRFRTIAGSTATHPVCVMSLIRDKNTTVVAAPRASEVGS